MMKPIHSILYLCEPAADPDPGLERACALAAETQASLTVLTVAPQLPAAGGLTQEEVDRAIGDHHLERLAGRLAAIEGATGVQTTGVQTRAAFGRPHMEAIREVLRGGHDLVIKTAEEGGGLRERMLGSHDMHLLRKCPCPVWLVRGAGNYPYRRILAAVDFDPGVPEGETRELNRRILEWAAGLAIATFTELHLVHVWEAPAEGMLRLWGAQGRDPAVEKYIAQTRAQHAAWLDGLLGDLREWIGPEAYAYLSLFPHMPRGSAADLIPQLAADLGADIIVMGTLGRSGIPGLLIGNTAETILNRCECAVLAIKPPDFVSPVAL